MDPGSRKKTALTRSFRPTFPGVWDDADALLTNNNFSTAPRVEVTVQSLSGVTVSEENSTATVAFSGSASNMQVGSSRLCAQTGLLVVESEPRTAHSTKFQWPTGQPPHLTVTIPPDQCQTSGAAATATPLQKANRDSRMVKVDESILSCTPSNRSYGGGSAVWDNSTLPEIVELTVRVADQEGIAYLVFFGHKDDRGTCIMDLPVRKPAAASSSKSVLRNDARLRVQVTVVVPDHEDMSMIPPAITACSTGSSSFVQQDDYGIQYTSMMMKGPIGPLMEKLYDHDQKALDHCHRARRYATDGVDMEPHDDEVDEGRPVGFCQGIWSWDVIRQTVAAAVPRCNGKMARFPIIRRRRQREDDTASFSSSIATKESWGM